MSVDRFSPNLTAKTFYDSLTYGQANTCALIFRNSIQALKDNEYLIQIFIFHTDAVISHAKNPFIFTL